MAIVFICWVVLSIVLSMALFRAAARRPLPHCEEEFASGPEHFDVPAHCPKLQKPLPVAKPRAEVLANSYTTL
jgi:hypothetical protein